MTLGIYRLQAAKTEAGVQATSVNDGNLSPHEYSTPINTPLSPKEIPETESVSMYIIDNHSCIGDLGLRTLPDTAPYRLP